jgi:hypothetical protein
MTVHFCSERESARQTLYYQIDQRICTVVAPSEIPENGLPGKDVLQVLTCPKLKNQFDSDLCRGLLELGRSQWGSGGPDPRQALSTSADATKRSSTTLEFFLLAAKLLWSFTISL